MTYTLRTVAEVLELQELEILANEIENPSRNCLDPTREDSVQQPLLQTLDRTTATYSVSSRCHEPIEASYAAKSCC